MMMTKSDGNSASHKYSRYRNTRRIRVPDSHIESQKSPTDQNDVSSIGSMTRYRRPKDISKAVSPAIVPVPQGPIAHVNTSLAGVTPGKLSPPRHKFNDEDKLLNSIEQVEQKISTSDDKEYRPTKIQANSPKNSTDKIAEQKLKDLERLKVQLDAAYPVSSTEPSNHKPEKLTRLFPRRKESLCTPPRTRDSSISSSRMNSSPESLKSFGIEQGRNGVIPHIDAPISAVNSGERRVLVRFKQSSISLPVTIETTSVDIMKSAADVLNQEFTPSSTVLLESFMPLGLERRIRKYEHIRDILNSWDRDTQNSLILEESCNKYDEELSASYVSSEPPTDMTVIINHSQKPGKWNKRHVTLLSSGQIFIAKHSGAKPTDKDSSNICHLSDFDIYKPVSNKALKALSPVGKNCFAIKSQQKSTVFLSSENFVHYFSTANDSVGEKLFTAVQRWRSWFLVNRMGEGIQESNQTTTTKVPSTRLEPQKTHPNRASGETNFQVSSSIQPLIKFSRSNTENLDETVSQDASTDDHFQKNPRRCQSQKYPAKSRQMLSEESGEFPSSSLLGRTYSERKRNMEENMNKKSNRLTLSYQNDETSHSQSLLKFSSSFKEPWNGSGKGHGVKSIDGIPLVDIATSTFSQGKIEIDDNWGRQRSVTNSSNLSGEKSNHSLLQFNSSPKEPPQWNRSGKGHGVRPVDGRPLVDIAITPSLQYNDMTRSKSLYMGKTSKRCEGPFVKGGLVSELMINDQGSGRKF